MEDCRIGREKRLLQFLVPIFSPDKPTTIVIKLAKCIYSALLHGKKVGWGISSTRWRRRRRSKLEGPKVVLSPLFSITYTLITNASRIGRG